MIDPDTYAPPASLEPLAKILPAGQPLVATCWTCPTCGRTKRGGPPPVCFEAPERAGCPVDDCEGQP